MDRTAALGKIKLHRRAKLPSEKPMRILGALLAGGKARRFGSDKAHALYRGARMIDLVASALRAQCDELVVCGREEPGFDCIADRPHPDCGPLGGLSAAIHLARHSGYDAVLSAGCDIPNLPHGLIEALAGDGAAIVRSQPVVGFWPVQVDERLDVFLAAGERKLFDFAQAVGARLVTFEPALLNINRPEDLS